MFCTKLAEAPEGRSAVCESRVLRIRSSKIETRKLPKAQSRLAESSLETARSGRRFGLGVWSWVPTVTDW